MLSLLSLIRYVPLIVILVFTIVRFCQQRKTVGAQDYRPLLVSLVSVVGCLMAPSLVSISFLSLKIHELSVGFILVAIGALTGKRLWSLIGAVWFSLHATAVFLSGQGGALKAGVSVIACLLLTGVVFYQNKAQKKLPLAFWIVLAALCLISSNRGVNLTLLAMIVWFSPKFAFMDKQVHAPVAPETTAKGVLEDKLAMLENLQALLSAGAISQEEFDAKKKDILGL